VKYGTRQYGMALILMVLLGTFFASANNAHAFITTMDKKMNPTMLKYTLDDWLLQVDNIATNVQHQTAEAISTGKPYPISKGYASAMGNYFGIGQTGSVISTTGPINFKTTLKAVVKNIITSVLNDIKLWARGGFKGKPNFIADWKGMLETSIIDASAELVNKIPILSQFCSPLNVMGSPDFFKKSLSQAKPTFSKYVQKNYKTNNKCTIETLITNARGAATNYRRAIDKFSKSWDPKAGSLMAAGLMDPNTNMMGLYFQAKDESIVRTKKNTEIKKTETAANSGFMNISDGCVGSPDPVTKEKYCPAKMAGEFVKDNLAATGLGQFSDLIDSNDLNDLFAAVANSAFTSLTTSISNVLQPIIGDAIKNISF
jgi:hypothetical protein